MIILKLIKNFFQYNKIISEYCNFNKKLYGKLDTKRNKNEILIEFNAFQVQHVAYSIISNILSRKFKAKIKAYSGHSLLVSPLRYNLINEIKWIVGNV